jgi:leader peptidase (prepilin peptidase) / N-methyltransferase
VQLAPVAAAAAAGLVLGPLLRSVARPWVPATPATRPPVVELATAALLVATVLVHHEDVPRLVLGILLVVFLVPLTLVDLGVRLLPNRLTGPAAAVALFAGTLLDPGGELGRLLAGAAAGGCFLLAALASPAGMGIGDVKLAGVLGLYLGGEVAVAVFAALLGGVAFGLIVIARKGAAAGRKTVLPFGPFLALGGVVGLFAGDEIVDWYLDTFA